MKKVAATILLFFALIGQVGAQLEACLPAFCGQATGGPCSAFSIPSQTSLVTWIDACSRSNFTFTTGSDVVQQAADLSSNHYSYFPGPIGPDYLSTAFNGRPTLQFSGTATLTSLNNTSVALGAGNEITIFAVATIATDSNGFHANGPLMSYTASGASSAYNNVGSFGFLTLGTTSNYTFDRNLVTNGVSVTRNTPVRVIFTLKSDGTKTIYLDGVPTSVAGAVNNFVSPGYMSIGGSQFDSSFFGGNYAGLVSEIGIYNVFYDSTQVAALDTYLKNKWGF